MSRIDDCNKLYKEFFAWLNDQVAMFQPFPDLPGVNFDDLVSSSNLWDDEKFRYYSDVLFDLWLERVYNKNKKDNLEE